MEDFVWLFLDSLLYTRLAKIRHVPDHDLGRDSRSSYFYFLVFAALPAPWTTSYSMTYMGMAVGVPASTSWVPELQLCLTLCTVLGVKARTSPINSLRLSCVLAPGKHPDGRSGFLPLQNPMPATHTIHWTPPRPHAYLMEISAKPSIVFLVATINKVKKQIKITLITYYTEPKKSRFVAIFNDPINIWNCIAQILHPFGLCFQKCSTQLTESTSPVHF